MLFNSARKTFGVVNRRLSRAINDHLWPLNVAFWHAEAFKRQRFDSSQQLNGYISIKSTEIDSRGNGEIVYQLKWSIWNFWNLKD